jgi:polysaccharide biosynthesis protein PslE
MNSNYAHSGVKEFFYVFFKHKRKIGIIFCSVVIAIVILSFVTPAAYQASTKVLIKFGRENTYTPAVAAPGGAPPVVIDGFRREEQINSEIEMLKARNLIEKVISVVGIEKLYPDLRPRSGAETARQMERAVVLFEKKLTVVGVKKSNVISIKFEHSDPVIAAQVLNVLVDVFVEQRLVAYREPQSFGFFGEQVRMLGEKLKRSEKDLELFQTQQNIAALEEQKAALLRQISDGTLDLSRTSAELSEHRGKKVSLEGHSGAPGAGSQFGKETDLNLQAISAIRARLSELKLKEAELLGRYTPESVLVTNVRREIQKAEELLAKEEKTYHDKEVKSIGHAMEGLRQKEQTQRQHLAGLQGELRRINGLEMRHKELVRQSKLDEENYQLYVRKTEEGRVSNAMDLQKMVNISVVEPAQPPIKPAKPRMFLNIILAVFMGGALSIGAAFFSEHSGRTINNKDDAEGTLGISVLAAIPETRS